MEAEQNKLKDKINVFINELKNNLVKTSEENLETNNTTDRTNSVKKVGESHGSPATSKTKSTKNSNKSPLSDKKVITEKLKSPNSTDRKKSPSR